MNKDLTDCSYEFEYFHMCSGVCFEAYELKVRKKMFKVFFLTFNYISKKYIIST